MKRIKEILEGEGKLENVKSSLASMINAALKAVKEIAPQGSGERLYKEIENYRKIMELARYYLTEDKIKEISERFNQLTRIWAKPYQSTARVIR